MKLNLGCSDNHIKDYINVDIVQPCDELVDLTKPWPWRDDAVSEILAFDIIEHLPDKIHTMNELWRVSVKGNSITKIAVPTTDGPGAWQDPTHVSYWNENSFWYFTKGNPHFERFHKAYGIKGGFKVEAMVKTAPLGVPKLELSLMAIY